MSKKTFINLQFFLSILIVFFLIAFSGCSNSSNNDYSEITKEQLYGTWYCETQYNFTITIEISENSLQYTTSKNVDFYVNNLVFIKTFNNRESTKNEYYEGFIIHGVEESGNTYSVPYFINSQLNKLSQNGSNNIFIKLNIT